MKMWHRIALANVATLTGLLLLFGVVMTHNTVRTLRTELDRRAKSGAELVARQVDGTIRTIEHCGNTIVVMINDGVVAVRPGESIPIADRATLQNRLAFALSVFPAVAHAWLVFPDGQVVGHGRIAAQDHIVAPSTARYLSDDAPMGPNTLVVAPEAQMGASRLLLYKRFISIASGEPAASLVLAADERSFRPSLAETGTDLRATFRIADGASDLVASDEFSEFESPVSSVDWTVVSRVSRRVVGRYALRVVGLHGIFLIAAVAIALPASLALSRSLTKPLEVLEYQMRRMNVEEGLGTINAPGVWEVDHVADGANRLLERVHGLVEKVAREERKRQRYHLELLQAQVKPHFLYNALETIHMLGDGGNIRRSQRALRELGDYYRLSLSGGTELISLDSEIKLTEHYLFIQHLRYRDLFSFSIDRSGPSLETTTLPKLTIQPLVENALYHGIKGMVRTCTIAIGIETFPDAARWRITVSDDGRGMSAERLAELRNLTVDGSFGIRSVIERLRLYLSPDIEWSIDSTERGGTTVTIAAPSSIYPSSIAPPTI